MATSVYHINKGVNRSIEFRGLKAQYIWYLAAGLVGLMILFALLYILGVPSLLCIALIAGLGTLLVLRIYRLSNKYGEYGMMKFIASKRVPRLVRCDSRAVFTSKGKMESLTKN